MNSPDHAPRARPTWAKVLLAAVVIGVLAVGVIFIRSRRLPPLIREQYDSQKAKWDEAEISNYDVSVTVQGMQPGVYEVQVQNGIAVAAKFDGRELTRPRTFGTWAVTGMFHTLATDLETNDKHGYLKLGVEFHPEYGIPMKYQRIEMRTGAHDALQWEVTRFEPRR